MYFSSPLTGGWLESESVEVGHPVKGKDAGEGDQQVEGCDHHKVETQDCRDLGFCPHGGHEAGGLQFEL